MIIKNLALLTVLLFFGNWTIKAQQFGYVEIGGGGYVTSVIGCPTEPNLFYAKTDIGGIFRWQESTQSWKQLFGWVASNQTSYLGVEAIEKSNMMRIFRYSLLFVVLCIGMSFQTETDFNRSVSSMKKLLNL